MTLKQNKFIFFSFSSINNRIILGATVIVFGFMFLTVYTLNKAFYNSAYTALEERLTAQVYLLMADRELNPSGIDSAPQALSVNLLHNTYSSLSGFVTQADGTILWMSSGSDKRLIPPIQTVTHGKKLFQQFTVNNKPYISLSIAIFWDPEKQQLPLIYHITDDLTQLQDRMSSYQHDLFSNLLLMSVFLLGTLTVLLRWGLKPLREVEGEIKSVEHGKQDRLENNYPDELTPLTENINQLIQYERQQQLRYRNALDDLAHSLKTPLAIIRGQKFNANEPESYLNSINDATQRMNSIVEYQLQRASTTSVTPHIQFIQLSPIIHSILESMKKIHRNKTIHFNTRFSDDLEYKIDEGDFMEILGNLLDNACKWCKDEINLYIDCNDNALDIIIADNGPGIPADKIQAITNRGFRADELTPGHGVGLAIVRDIVKAYNGTIEFHCKNNAGLEVSIHFQL